MKAERETIPSYDEILANYYRFYRKMSRAPWQRRQAERFHNTQLTAHDLVLNEFFAEMYATDEKSEIDPELVNRFIETCAEVAEHYGLSPEDMNRALNDLMQQYEEIHQIAS